MSDILKITKDTITAIFSTIKSEISSVQTALASNISSLSTTVNGLTKYIIAAALQGKKVTSYSGIIPTDAKVAGTLLYNTSTKKYYYYNGSKATEITLDLFLQAANGNNLFPTRQWWQVHSNNWNTATPFEDQTGAVTAIYKGETAGDYTKWLIVMDTESEDQTYAINNTTEGYTYKTRTVEADTYNEPWEIWLPNSITSGVEINYA